MKKWFVFSIPIAAIISVYILIPNEVVIKHDVLIACNAESMKRCLYEKGKWAQWWPAGDKNAALDSALTLNNYQYSISELLSTGVRVNMSKAKNDYQSEIFVLPIINDSDAVQWSCSFATSLNPLKRIWQYLQARDIKKNMESVLSSLKDFAEKDENIYGFKISHTTLTDNFLMSIKVRSTKPLDTDSIYVLTNKLHQYILNQRTKETNYPMLNVSKFGNVYETMIAIATEKELKSEGDICVKYFERIPNKTLTTEVMGGPEKIKEAHQAIEDYMLDHQLTSPVIPFEIMVTNRSLEKDSNKWVTRVYYTIV